MLTAYFSPGSLYLCTSGLFSSLHASLPLCLLAFFSVLLSCYPYIHFTLQSSSETQPAHPSSSFVCLPYFLFFFNMFYHSTFLSLFVPLLLFRGLVRKVSDVDSSFCLPASYHFLLCSDFIYHFIYFSITSFPRPLPVSVPGSPLFNSPVPPCFPLRSFPNFWSPSGAAWRGLFLSSLPSRQEQHWNWKLCLLSTTTTRRPTNCWSAGGFADS